MPMLSYDHDISSSESEEDYINMEVQDSSFSANNEFEFQSFSSSSEKDQLAMTSPADELFYMGKLLPLHLPPRLDMVQKIFQHDTKPQLPEESLKTTPFQSHNISPSVSRHVSLECTVSFTKEKKPWSKKLTKWSILKSLFTKTGGCADNSRSDAATSKLPVPKHCNSVYTDVKPFEQIKYNRVSSFEKDEGIESSGLAHRRSFSGAESKNTSNVFKRSNSLSSSEVENPIQAAIAHCKRVP